jgi:hypothetical protein
MKKLLTCSILAAAAMALPLHAQTTVYSDNFNVSQGTTYTTSGNIGTSDWTVARSGADWGALINDGIMTLNNTASAETRVNGWVYAYQTLADTGDFSTIFSNSGDTMVWTFNMRQIRPNPAGFNLGGYGAAYVLGATSTDVFNSGNGYAVVLGNTTSPDPLRLVSFTGGLTTLGTAATGLIVASSPLDNPTNNYMSIQVTYDPSSNLWEMLGRDDGSSSFSDPKTGTLTSLGTVTDDTYTGVSLTSSGAYWQGSTAANQTAFFDNASLEVVPEPSTYALLALSGLALAGYAARRRQRQK